MHKHSEPTGSSAPLLGIVLTIAWLTGCEPPPPVPQTIDTSANPRVMVREGRVTLQASDVVLHALLIELARQSELEIMLQETLQDRVTLAILDQPLQVAVGRMLQNHSFALFYIPVRHVDDDLPPNRLWVFTPEPTGNGNELASSAAGDRNADSMAGLTFALAHEDENVRLDALATFGLPDSRRLPPVLANAALVDRSAAVRAAALDALGELGDNDALASLEQALYDRSAQVREAALSAIEQIGGPDTIPVLSAALDSQDPRVREQAVDALGEIGSDTAIAALQQALSDTARSVREAAEDYLYEKP